MGPAPKRHFVLVLPSEGLEIPKIGTPTTLETPNFVCRPPIEMKSKVITFLESFPMICDTPFERKKIREIFDF